MHLIYFVIHNNDYNNFLENDGFFHSQSVMLMVLLWFGIKVNEWNVSGDTYEIRNSNHIIIIGSEMFVSVNSQFELSKKYSMPALRNVSRIAAKRGTTYVLNHPFFLSTIQQFVSQTYAFTKTDIIKHYELKIEPKPKPFKIPTEYIVHVLFFTTFFFIFFRKSFIYRAPNTVYTHPFLHLSALFRCI